MEIYSIWFFIYVWAITFAFIGWVWSNASLKKASTDLEREINRRIEAEKELLSMRISMLQNEVREVEKRKERKDKNVRSK